MIKLAAVQTIPITLLLRRRSTVVFQKRDIEKLVRKLQVSASINSYMSDDFHFKNRHICVLGYAHWYHTCIHLCACVLMHM